jgi:hypothetical protein
MKQLDSANFAANHWNLMHRHSDEGICEVIVVGEDGEPTTLQHVPEMVDAGRACQQFPVEGSIPGLGWFQLLGKKTKRFPDHRTWVGLMQACAYVRHRGAEDSTRKGMSQVGGKDQYLLRRGEERSPAC